MLGDIPANVAGMNGMQYMPAAGAQHHEGEQQTPKAGVHALVSYVHQSLYPFHASSGSIRRGIKMGFCPFFLAALTSYPWPFEMTDALDLAAAVAPNFMMSERMQNMELGHHMGL